MRLSKLALGLAALAATAPTQAARLCDSPCSFTLDFPAGGSIEPTGPVTIDLDEGSELRLGQGGAITLGEGGELQPTDDQADFSNGGRIHLGPGGSIEFGPGGVLRTPGAGQIELAAASVLDISGARNVDVDASTATHIGVVRSEGRVRLEAATRIDGDDTSTPIHFTMETGSTQSELAILSASNITLERIDSAGTVDVVSHGSGESGTDTGTPPPDSSTCPDSGSGASISTGSGTPSSSCPGQVVTAGPVGLSNASAALLPAGGGALGPGLLVLLLAGLRGRLRG